MFIPYFTETILSKKKKKLAKSRGMGKKGEWPYREEIVYRKGIQSFCTLWNCLKVTYMVVQQSLARLFNSH